MQKKLTAFIFPGKRTKDWLKIKTGKRQEVVIGGFTNNEGSNKLFSAFLGWCYMKMASLRYTGKIGTGFSQKLQAEMMQQFKPLITNKMSF